MIIAWLRLHGRRKTWKRNIFRQWRASTQALTRPFDQRTDEVAPDDAMPAIAIGLRAPEPLRLSHFLPAAGSVTRTKPVLLNKGLGQQHRVAVALLPIIAQPLRVKPEDPARQIRNALPPRQNQEARIVHHQMPALLALDRRPADPRHTILQVPRSRTPSQTRQPATPLIDRDVTDLLPDHSLETLGVMTTHLLLPTNPFSRFIERTNCHRGEVNAGLAHAVQRESPVRIVQQKAYEVSVTGLVSGIERP